LAVLEIMLRGGMVGEVTAQAIAIAVATPFNFVGNKLWTFG
jgi:putative flippase GtrA